MNTQVNPTTVDTVNSRTNSKVVKGRCRQSKRPSDFLDGRKAFWIRVLHERYTVLEARMGLRKFRRTATGIVIGGKNRNEMFLKPGYPRKNRRKAKETDTEEEPEPDGLKLKGWPQGNKIETKEKRAEELERETCTTRRHARLVACCAATVAVLLVSSSRARVESYACASWPITKISDRKSTI